MIDPRQEPVAMLPILNALAGHMIAKHAPLRIVNVEDTEQMITEACDTGGFDCDALENFYSDLEFTVRSNHEAMSFYDTTHRILSRFEEELPNSDHKSFLRVLEATIEESV